MSKPRLENVAHTGSPHLVISLLVEEHVNIEHLHQELDLNCLVHALAGNADRLLQAFCYSFSITKLERGGKEREEV